jgi:hypothetical protein
MSTDLTIGVEEPNVDEDAGETEATTDAAIAPAEYEALWDLFEAVDRAAAKIAYAKKPYTTALERENLKTAINDYRTLRDKLSLRAIEREVDARSPASAQFCRRRSARVASLSQAKSALEAIVALPNPMDDMEISAFCDHTAVLSAYLDGEDEQPRPEVELRLLARTLERIADDVTALGVQASARERR